MSAKLIVVQLQTPSGAAISDAVVTVRRVRTKALIEDTSVLGGGEGRYKIFEDNVVQDLRPEGEPFDVTFTRAGRTHRVRLIIGMDAGRCHVDVRRGPTTITFPGAAD
jgi:hypothetical protein